MEEPFVVVVHRNGEIFFGVFLADYVLVEILFYLFGLWNFFEYECRPSEMFSVLLDDVVAQFDTFRTDKDAVRALDEWLNLTSGPAAETADGLYFFIVRALGHYSVPIQKLNRFYIVCIIVSPGYLYKVFYFS